MGDGTLTASAVGQVALPAFPGQSPDGDDDWAAKLIAQ
jgi:hypothetical protein